MILEHKAIPETFFTPKEQKIISCFLSIINDIIVDQKLLMKPITMDDFLAKCLENKTP